MERARTIAKVNLATATQIHSTINADSMAASTYGTISWKTSKATLTKEGRQWQRNQVKSDKSQANFVMKKRNQVNNLVHSDLVAF